jgi:hypothetical protein
MPIKELNFTYGTYDNMAGYWAEITTEDGIKVHGGHFNAKADVYRFYCKSRRYFGERLKSAMSIDYTL